MNVATLKTAYTVSRPLLGIAAAADRDPTYIFEHFDQLRDDAWRV